MYLQPWVASAADMVAVNATKKVRAATTTTDKLDTAIRFMPLACPSGAISSAMTSLKLWSRKRS
jgi:hypothetical protein